MREGGLVYTFDSLNRRGAPESDTNGFTIDLNTRLSINAAVVGNVMVPLAQYTVEEDWCDFACDFGAKLPPSLKQRSIKVPRGEGFRTLAVLPAPAQVVILKGRGTSDSPATWRASEPLGLYGSSLYHVSPSVFLPLRGDGQSPTFLELPVLQIFDAFAFSTQSSPALERLAGDAPAVLVMHEAGPLPLKSAEQLVALLNASLSSLNVASLRYSYSRTEARVVEERGADAVVDCGDLASFLGSSPGQVYPRGARVCRLPSANYNEASLRREIELQLSGHLCEGTASLRLSTSTSSEIILVDLRGDSTECLRKALAESALAQAAGVAVTSVNGRLVLESAESIALDVQQSLAQHLGMEETIGWTKHYVGASRGEPWDAPIAVALPDAVNRQSISAIGRFAFKLTTLSRATTHLQVNGRAIAQDDGCAPLPGQLFVAVDGDALAAIYSTREGASTAFFPVPGSGPLRQRILAAPVVSQRSPAFNVYVRTQRLAEVLGFSRGANHLAPTEERLHLAPKRWCLDGPSYLLLEADVPHSSASNVHSYERSTRSEILAVLPLYHTGYKLERGAPMSKLCTGPVVLSSISFRLLNPDHSLYRLHGREWALTIVFGCDLGRASTLCL